MRAELVTSAIRPFVATGVVPGAIVGVRDRGEATGASLGVTEPAGLDPLPVDALVRISSNTKPMIAALALLLAQDGVLALDDPVERFSLSSLTVVSYAASTAGSRTPCPPGARSPSRTS